MDMDGPWLALASSVQLALLLDQPSNFIINLLLLDHFAHL